MGMHPAELYPTLTRSRCDCCGEEFVDPVGELVIWDAVYTYRSERRAKERREQAAWDAADAATAAALGGGG